MAELDVAVYGGDERVHGLEGTYEGGIEVTTYSSNKPAQLDGLSVSLRQHAYDALILLTKWHGHADYQTVKAACVAGGVRLIYWNHGLGKLEDELPALVRGDTPATNDNAEAPDEEDEELPVHVQARNQGMTVACFQTRHTDCVYAGKEAESLKCGCDCHPRVEVVEPTPPAQVTVQPEPDPEVLPTEKPFVCTMEDVVDALNLEPTKNWRVSEVGDLLGAKTKIQHSRVHTLINRLIISGQVEIAHQGTASKTNPRLVRLVPEKKETPPMLPMPTTPSQEWIVRLPDNSFRTFPNKGEALEFLGLMGSTGMTLFKQVKLVVKLDVEE